MADRLSNFFLFRPRGAPAMFMRKNNCVMKKTLEKLSREIEKNSESLEEIKVDIRTLKNEKEPYYTTPDMSDEERSASAKALGWSVKL